MNWDLNPEITKLFGIISVRYYSLLFAFGLILAYKILEIIVRKEKKSIKKLDQLFFYIIAGTIIGARLGHCLFYEPKYYLHNITEVLLPIQKDLNGNWEIVGYRGLSSHGGTIGVLIAIFLFSKKNNLNYLFLLDRIAIVTPLVATFIRIGNFMNSEIIGKPINSSWGVVFQRIDNIPRHPAQLYEALSYLLIFVLLFTIYRRKPKFNNGYFFGLFLILLFTSRFIIEFYKINQVEFENFLFLNMGQLLSIPFIIIGFLFFKKSLSINSKTI